MLYIAVIFLYTSYSACIVALLQSTTNSIRNLEDLYQSGMGLGVQDVVYNRHYFSVMPLKQVLLLSAAYSLKTIKKGKTILLETCTGPEGSRMLRLPDFMIIGARRW
jgi:hypothetical protein